MLRARTFIFAALCAAVVISTLSVSASAQNAAEVEEAKRKKQAAEEAAKKEAEEAARMRDMDEAARKEELVRSGVEKKSRPGFRVYEWGAETRNWDGSAEAENAGDIPSFYYRADQIPVEADPSVPEVIKPEAPPRREPVGGGMDKKPVLYFESPENILFDLEVNFTCGDVTRVYPKANRRTNPRNVQWDNVQLYDTRSTKPGNFTTPTLRDVKEDHWANYSRGGSTSSLVVNGEHEKFIFYEGANTTLPEVDIFKNADDHFVIRNYTPFPIYSVRWTFLRDGKQRRLCAREVPAASGETPGELVLTAGGGGVYDMISEMQADLAIEASTAGLTVEQAAAFARCWHADVTDAKAGTLSYRRDSRQLDALMALKITLPKESKLQVEFARVGYVVLNGVDLDKQAELDGWARAAAAGGKDEAAKLVKLGPAGVGAVRRAMADKATTLKQRLVLAKLLKEFDK